MKRYGVLYLGLYLYGLFCSAWAWAAPETIYFNRSRSLGAELKTYVDSDAATSGLSDLEVHLNINGLTLDEGADGFSRIDLPGLDVIGVDGKPALQGTGTLLAVPRGFDAKFVVQAVETKTIRDVLVAPFQKKQRCVSEGANAEVFSFDSELYQRETEFPSNIIDLEDMGQIQGIDITRLAINPVRHNPKLRTLEVATKLKIRVEFVRDYSEQIRRHRLTRAFYHFVRNVTTNGKTLGQYLAIRQETEGYVIYTADEFKEALAPFVKWKEANGFQVELVTFTEAGNTKEKVKEHLKQNYITSAARPSYVLLVGNAQTMPPFFVKLGDGFGGGAASDYPFAMVDGEDALPDLFYGRLLADNVEEVQTQIDRWIQYEKTPTREEWYPYGMTIASNEGFNPSDAEYAQQVAEALEGHTYTKTDRFQQGQQTATAEAITEGLTEGRSWLAYFGHGSGTGWGSTNDTFDNEQVKALINADRLPVLIDVACANAQYPTIPECFGKVWMTHQHEGKHAGAVAFYGGSVNISWHPPAIMSVGIAKYHGERKLYSLGASVFGGQMYLFEKNGLIPSTLDNLKWYNLFGDPSLQIRTNVPQEYKVEASLENNFARVRATDLDGKALADLTVSVTTESDRGPVGTAITDSNGEVTIRIPSQTSQKSYFATVTGYNAETHHIALN